MKQQLDNRKFTHKLMTIVLHCKEKYDVNREKKHLAHCS